MMNDQSPNNERDREIARKLSQVAEQTHVKAQFAAELEERLRASRQPRTGWLAAGFKQVSPAFRWAALMILLAVALSWSIRTLVSAPQPAVENTPVMPDLTTPTSAPGQTPTPVASEETYNWRGAALHLAAALPESPTEANVFLLQPEQPATVEEARALAQRFGVEGPAYVTPGSLPGAEGYLITDGRQRLMVQSDLTYDYYSDYSTYSYMGGARDLNDDQAAAAIDAFLKSHGYDFEYKIENPFISPGMYHVLPLTADGFTVRHNYGIPERLALTLDDDGDVMLVSSYRIGYEAVGVYGIRSAEEAFQQVLDQSDTIWNGVLEITHSTGKTDVGSWSRIYPDDRMITLYSQITVYPALEPGESPLITIAQHPASGNVAGMENVETGVYVEATGQFLTENGIRQFNVEAWKLSDLQETGVSGTLRREGDQTILTADNGSGEYTIVDAPADLPLNTTIGEEYLAVYGMIVGNRLEWGSIQYYPSGSGGGGGGGGGNGFYQLNLSGTPVPFPSPTATSTGGTGTNEYIVKEGDTCGSIADRFGISVQSLIDQNQLLENCLIFVGQKLVVPGSGTTSSLVGQRLEGQRGISITSIYRKADGSERVEYGLSLQPAIDSNYFLVLEGTDLEPLQAYHNRPVDIWGTIERVDENGIPVLRVERYEIPFPDLQIQVLQGTQRLADVNGQQTALFTTADGTTYAQIITFDVADTTILGVEGDPILLEALAIPGETFGGYPALRVFGGAMASNPKNNDPTELSTTADQPYIVEEDPSIENGTTPTLTIETVELVYYVPDPRYGASGPNAGPHYIQPAWRFHGHYSNGDEFEILVQALKQEFLLPELAPYTPPG